MHLGNIWPPIFCSLAGTHTGRCAQSLATSSQTTPATASFTTGILPIRLPGQIERTYTSPIRHAVPWVACGSTQRVQSCRRTSSCPPSFFSSPSDFLQLFHTLLQQRSVSSSHRHRTRSPRNGNDNETKKMRIHTQIWTLLVTAAVGASLCTANVVSLVNNSDRLPSTTIEALPSSSITGTTTFSTKDFVIKSETQDAVPHVLAEDTSETSIASTTIPDTDKSPAAAEPDTSLQVAFLVLGLLLAMASVVVAVFFGYKQLSFMRTQSSIARNDIHDNSNGRRVDLEMGPVVVPSDASDGVGATIDPAVHNARPS
jgi:hypothetical protein